MKYYLRIIFSLFIIFWLNVLNAQLTLDKEYNNYRDSMHFYEQKNDYDSAIIYWQKLNEYGLKQGKKEYVYPSLMNLFHICSHFNKDVETLEVALNIHNLYLVGDSKDHNTDVWRVSLFLSNYMLRFENYEKALFYLNSFRKSDISSHLLCRELDYEFAKVLIKMGEADSALKIMDLYVVESEKSLFIKPNDLIGIYNECGLIYSDLGKYEQAIIFFEKAIFKIDSLNYRKTLKPVIQGNIGFCYFNLKEYSKAYELFNIDAMESFKNKEFSSYFEATLMMAKIEMIKGENLQVVTSINTLLKRDLFDLTLHQNKRCLDMLLVIFERQNDLKKMIDLHAEYKIVNDSLFYSNKLDYNNYISLSSNIIFEQIEGKMILKTDRLESDKTFLLNEIKLKNRNTIYLVLILFLITVSSALLFRKVILDKKQSVFIRKQEILIAEQKLNIEFEQKNLLELKIEQKNNRINHQRLELESKKLAAKKIIENLKEKTSILNPELSAIKVFINNELDVKSIGDQVHSSIDEIGGEFIENLKEKHVNLTDKEIKLCVMTTLKLSNKEIGISQNLTTATVKNNKNRLKKKLNLSAVDSLIDYLNQIV